jgi:hypothetical protein
MLYVFTIYSGAAFGIAVAIVTNSNLVGTLVGMGISGFLLAIDEIVKRK